MASSSSKSRAPLPKICPRCGAFYQDLPSKTCPQCFALLEPLSDEDAHSLIAEQESRAQDPEFLKVKADQDEQYKEQSFGACFGVVVIMIVTVIVCAMIVFVGARHYDRQRAELPGQVSITSAANLPPDFDAILPPKLVDSIRQSADVDQKIPGSSVDIYHARYSNDVQIYALPASSATNSNIATLRLAVSFAANQHNPAFSQKEESTPKAHYIVIGPQLSAIDALADAVVSKS